MALRFKLNPITGYKQCVRHLLKCNATIVDYGEPTETHKPEFRFTVKMTYFTGMSSTRCFRHREDVEHFIKDMFVVNLGSAHRSEIAAHRSAKAATHKEKRT